MDDEDLNELLCSTSPGKQLALNFMKTISLTVAAQQIVLNKDIGTADIIINNILEGYQFEEHSIQ